MLKKIIALFTAAALSAGICSCSKNNTEEETSSTAARKEIRKILDYDITEVTEYSDTDCPDFLKSGDIEKTLLFNDKGIEITAESVDYKDDHAELQLTVKNSNNYTVIFEKSIYVLNYIQNSDAGIFAANANSTDTWIYSIEYFPMARFGVEQLDTIQFGFRLYQYDGDKADIPEDTISALSMENATSVPASDSSDTIENMMAVFTTDVLHTQNYEKKSEEYKAFYDELYKNEYSEPAEEYPYTYYPEDPLLAVNLSGYADHYFLQKTENISSYITNDNADYTVMSAAFGEIKNEENPGNKWFQYSFYNGTDDIVSVTTQNIQINGLSVSSRPTSSVAINYLPGTVNMVHDILFSSHFNKAHWDIFGIDNIHSLSFDYVVTPSGKTSGKEHHADIFFDETENSFDTSGEKIYDKHDITVISKGIHENAAYYIGDYTAALLIKNNSSDDIYISAPLEISYKDDISFAKINGESASAYIKLKDTPLKIPADGYGEYLIYIDAPSLREININSADDIKDFSFSLYLRDYRERLIEQADMSISLK